MVGCVDPDDISARLFKVRKHNNCILTEISTLEYW